MTLIYAYKIPLTNDKRGGSGVVIGGDTIATVNAENCASPQTGISSQNQFIGTYYKNGILKTVSESACKIGKLNQNVLVGACGDTRLIVAILKYYFESPFEIRSYSDFFPNFTDILCQSLNPLDEFSPGTSAEFIFTIFDNGWITFVDLYYIIDERNLLKPSGKYFFPSVEKPAYFKGSGHTLFSDFSGSFHFNYDELYQTHALQQATAMEVSNHISKKTSADARVGVGGAILTYCMDSSGFHAPEDTLYLYANKNLELTILSKVCYRDGYFYLVDYIEKQITRFTPLELQVRGEVTATDDNIQNILQDVSKFNGKWLFLTREINEPSAYKAEILIQGNIEEKVMRGDDDLSLRNLKNRGIFLDFINEGKKRSFDLKVRQ